MKAVILAKATLLIFPIIVMLTILGCEKEKKILNTSDLIGTWQLVEQDSDLTDGETPEKIKRYKITFNPDSTFNSEKYTSCNNGTFSVRGDQHLLFEYDCPDKQSLLGNGLQTEKFEMNDGYLYLIPTYLNCIEGCYSKFEKISD